MRKTHRFLLAAALLGCLSLPQRTVAQEEEHNRCRQHHFGRFSDWSEPVNLGPIVNSPFNNQSPAISADGLSLYISSNRTGSLGTVDIWVSRRATLDDDWSPPQNLGPIINTSLPNLNAVPTFSYDGHRMYFCSDRPGSFASGGNTDIWVSFREDATDDFAWQLPTHLGPGVNTTQGQCGPTIFEDPDEGVTTLYFARCVSASCAITVPPANQKADIYASTLNDDGTFGTAVAVAELNSGFRDTRTAIRNDGLEMFLSSSRPGGIGGLDLWVSTRKTTLEPWGAPVNLGPTVNTKDNEGAPALSCDGTTLYFFSNRPGGFGKSDLYMTTRVPLDDGAATRPKKSKAGQQ